MGGKEQREERMEVRKNEKRRKIFKQLKAYKKEGGRLLEKKRKKKEEGGKKTHN